MSTTAIIALSLLVIFLVVFCVVESFLWRLERKLEKQVEEGRKKLQENKEKLRYCREETRKLDEYNKRLRTALDKAKALQVRIESYPDEIQYIIDDMEPLSETMRVEAYKMKEALMAGDFDEAMACRIRGMAAIEEAEAMSAEVDRKRDEWNADSELLKQLIEELKNI
jgi:hypothetical protein